MKKKLLTLAVALMTAVTSWADTTVSYDFEDGATLFSFPATPRLTVTNVTSDVDTDANSTNVLLFTCASNAQNGFSFGYYDFSDLLTKATNISISFDTYLTNGGRAIITLGDASVRGEDGNSSKTTYNSSGAVFRIGSNKSYAFLNSSENLTIGDYTNKWVSVSVDYDVAAKTYSYTVKDMDGGDVISSGEDISAMSEDGGTISQIDFFGYINNSLAAYLDNLTISVTESTEEYAEYTVKYVNESNEEIATSKTYSAAIGSNPSINTSDKGDITYNDQKYIYDTDDSESVTVASDGSSVITLTYREAATYSYTVVTSTGTTLATGSGFEGDAVSVAYPRYQLVGTTLYYKAANSNEYHQSVTLSEDNQVETLAYTANTENVVYYIEAEEIAGMTATGNLSHSARCSNALGGYNASDEDVTVITLPAGSYTIYGACRSSSNSNTIANTVYAGETEVLSITSTGSWKSGSGEFTLTEATALTIPSGGVETAVLDYIYIVQTAAPVTVSDAGYATYVPAVNVQATDDVTFYAVTDGDDYVTLTEVTAAPAGTPLLIEAAAGTYELTIIDEATEFETALVAAETDITCDGTEYVLASVDNVVGFYQAEAGTTLAAGKCYISSASAAKVLRIVNETTGVAEVEAVAETAEGVAYNLAGQKVNANAKGIVIINGKKYVNK